MHRHRHTCTHTHTHTLSLSPSPTFWHLGERVSKTDAWSCARTHTHISGQWDWKKTPPPPPKKKRHSACQVWNCQKVGTPQKNVVSGICWKCEQDWWSWVGWAWKRTRQSKETVGNSWGILNAILGHKYQNHSNRVIYSSEWSQRLQQK